MMELGRIVAELAFGAERVVFEAELDARVGGEHEEWRR